MKTLRRVCCLLAASLLTLIVAVPVSAAENTSYTLGAETPVNTGKDNGYSGTEKLGKDDPHMGWSIGKFYVTGYTRQTESEGKPLFLKNANDKVQLHFSLVQDIDCLNDDNKLSIARDEKGWDKQMGVNEQDFGRGMLIIRHVDYQNNSKITKYMDFLAGAAEDSADTDVQVFEEGDYEVALDYAIKKTGMNIFGWKPMPSYNYYRLYFAFSVRNGNSMVFPLDAKTGKELSNTSFTENGFKLDLAQSHYLDADVKKSVLEQGADTLTEDTRFNKPAADGQVYSDEGVYTLTVTNRYTHEKTTKVIYVGNDDVLKAYATTGQSIRTIAKQISEGAKVDEDGTLISKDEVDEAEGRGISSLLGNHMLWVVVAAIIIILIVGGAVLLRSICKRQRAKGDSRPLENNASETLANIEQDMEGHK